LFSILSSAFRSDDLGYQMSGELKKRSGAADAQRHRQ